jgi:hypothetical protein
MKKIITLLLLASIPLLMVGCVSSSKMVSSDLEGEIPEEATEVIITSEDSPDRLYEKVYQALAQKGYPIQDSNNQMRSVTTGFKEIGQSTTLAVNASVTQADVGAEAVLTGRWGVTGSFATGLSAGTSAEVDKNVGEPAKWVPRERAGVAFGALAELAKGISSDGLSFKK